MAAFQGMAQQGEGGKSCSVISVEVSEVKVFLRDVLRRKINGREEVSQFLIAESLVLAVFP